MISGFAARAPLSELMDDPACNEALLLRTVRQFASINRLVGRYRSILRHHVLMDMQREPDRAYHLLDMGAGGCDIDVWLLAAARKRGLKLRITACDIDERIIGYARSTYGPCPGLEVVRKDLLSDPVDEPVDYVFANHFLHHLADEQIVRLLRKWHPHVRRRILFSDLLRHPGAYFGYSLLALFYPKSFARTDGLISIRRGFVEADFSNLTNEALPGVEYSVLKLVPGRLALCIEGTAGHPPRNKETPR